MNLDKAIELVKSEFNRLKYFKLECNACVPDDLIEAFETLFNYLDEKKSKIIKDATKMPPSI